ncbi:MAG: carboxy terminal-processing peptidase [Gammaproteobacteria bacterium]|nr:carboxy terminal-processing peptidase [Gammaproteobacteria bacterium]
MHTRLKPRIPRQAWNSLAAPLGSLLFLVALVVAPVFPASARSADTQDAGISASRDQERATELITHFIQRYHYRKRELNDELSASMFDRYLEALDPNRIYLMASDVEALSKFKYQLDDRLRESRLEPAFAIFALFRARLEERVEYAVSLLDKKFDFSIREEYTVDRSKAPWAEGREELDNIWRRRVKHDVLSLRLAGKADDDIRDTLASRYHRLVVRINQFDSDDVYQAFINAFTSSVEPHTSYFSRRASENFKIRMSLSLEGIGAALQNENEHTLVRNVIAGGPADLSGLLKTDDRIVGVGQGEEGEVVDVVGWRLADVVDLIRGPKGSVVLLEILPKGVPVGGQTKIISLVRNKIKLEEQAAQKSVEKVSTEDGAIKIGVIRVPTFYTDFEAREQGRPDFRSTSRDVRKLIKELMSERVKGLVIDLRGNGGGSLAEATELTGLFIKSGPIVQVRDSTGRISVNDDPDPQIAYDGPLAVLVDRASASASEIFAGAIQDYRRAIVIGEPTFGKGTVQRLLDLDRFAKADNGSLGQLKFTVAQFFRVNGDSTQHRGVVPDIVYPTAFDTAEQGERSLDNALPWAAVSPLRFEAGAVTFDVIEEARHRHDQRVIRDPGFQYLIAEAEAFREAREKNQVSLVEAERRLVWEHDEQSRLDRLNRYRQSRGLSRLDANPVEEDTDTVSEVTEEEPDILRQEAARILADVIELASDKKRLLTSGQPNSRWR